MSHVAILRVWNPESYVESHAQMKDGVPYGLFGGQDKLPEPRAMLRIVEAALERVHEQQFKDGDDGGDELFENHVRHVKFYRYISRKSFSAI